MRGLTAVLSMVVALSVASQRGGSTPSRAAQPAAQPAARHDGDLQLRINGPIHIAAGDTASTVWVVNHDATVDGVVREALGVVNGTARVTGRVEGSIVVVNGRLELAPGARVERDVLLYRSTITRAPGAVVAGVIHNQTGFAVGAGTMWLVWLSFTIVVVLAGLLFAELAPRTLFESASYLWAHGGRSALTGLVVACAVPAVALVSFATVIGIPLGLTLFFVVIPALSFLGYLVAGAAIGAALVARPGPAGAPPSRYRSIVVGLLALQVVGALPLLGGLVVLVASLLGVGALVARSWSQRARPLPTGIPATPSP